MHYCEYTFCSLHPRLHLIFLFCHNLHKPYFIYRVIKNHFYLINYFNNYFIQNFLILSLCRAILITWVAIITTAIPVALSHGIYTYPFEGGYHTSCIFLEKSGYKKVYFQVSFQHPFNKLMVSIIFE